jgi:hypothetical protein
VRVTELIGAEVGATDLADLALVAQLGQAPERLGDRRGRVGTMELVVVDVVGAQPAEARVEATADLGRVPAALTVGEARTCGPTSSRRARRRGRDPSARPSSSSDAPLP